MHAHTHTHTHARTHIHTCMDTHAHTHTHTHMHTHTHTHMHTHACTHTCTHTHMHTHTCTHGHTCTHAHTHIQKDLLKTKETLYRLAASVRQLPDRYIPNLVITTVRFLIMNSHDVILNYSLQLGPTAGAVSCQPRHSAALQQYNGTGGWWDGGAGPCPRSPYTHDAAHDRSV